MNKFIRIDRVIKFWSNKSQNIQKGILNPSSLDILIRKVRFKNCMCDSRILFISLYDILLYVYLTIIILPILNICVSISTFKSTYWNFQIMFIVILNFL